LRIPDLVNKSISIPDVIKFDFNVTGFKISDLSLDPTCKLMELFNDRLVFSFRNFTGNFGFSYMYISDPPIFADIGDFDFNLDNTTFLMDFDSNIANGVLDVLIHRLEMDIYPFDIKFDGISDISDVASRFLTYVGNVLRGRLTSIVAYTGPSRINPMINKVLEMIPDEKNIPGTQLYVEGGISDNFIVKEHDYIEIPLDMTLQNYSVEFNRTNDVNFGPYIDRGYQMQLYLSDYLFYSVINSLYYPGMYIANQSLPITTSDLDLVLLFNKLTKAGFDKKQPCIAVIRAIGDVPEIDINKKDGLISSFTLAFDIKCKKHASDQDYS
jgi:hypothetical protein